VWDGEWGWSRDGSIRWVSSVHMPQWEWEVSVFDNGLNVHFLTEMYSTRACKVDNISIQTIHYI